MIDPRTKWWHGPKGDEPLALLQSTCENGHVSESVCGPEAVGVHTTNPSLCLHGIKMPRGLLEPPYGACGAARVTEHVGMTTWRGFFDG